MTLQQTYIKAARRIHTHKDEFSCCAVSNVVFGRYHKAAWERTKYASVMSPRDNRTLYVYDVDEHTGSEEARDLRVWLLCMMAACCEDV